MTPVASHFVQVVVLAARADAFLGGRSADVITLLEPEEHVLELIHPCVCEEQRRIAFGHDRARRNETVVLRFEEREKAFAELVGRQIVYGVPSEAARVEDAGLAKAEKCDNRRWPFDLLADCGSPFHGKACHLIRGPRF